MRVRVLFLISAMVLIGGYGLLRWRTAAYTATPAAKESTASASSSSKIDFTTQVRPILDRCTPCHFSGGKMYEKLPFDRPATVRQLGEKLFSRIQAENDRKIIREFLAQNEDAK